VRKRLSDLMGGGEKTDSGSRGKDKSKGGSKSGKHDSKGAGDENDMSASQTIVSMVTTALMFAAVAYLFGGRGEP